MLDFHATCVSLLLLLGQNPLTVGPQYIFSKEKLIIINLYLV